MTLLVRLLSGGKHWRLMIKNGEVADCVANPPPWAIRELTPSDNDAGGLSVFEIDEDLETALPELERVAAAFAFHGARDIGAGQYTFVGVERAELEAAGIEVVATRGKQLVEFPDDRHREIRIEGLKQLAIVVELYLKSKLFFSVEGATAAEAARNAARGQEIDYLTLHKRGEGTHGGKNLVRFVSERVVAVSGVPLKAGAKA